MPFKMSAKARQEAIKRSLLPQKSEWDSVQLFRAKLPPFVAPAPEPHRKVRTRPCGACGGPVKVAPSPKGRKGPLKAARERHRKQKWWLYYGPDHMTGGFATKREAMDWYLSGGR